MNILSKGAAVKYALLRLVSLHRDYSICFLPHSVQDDAWSQRIWTWLLMRDLHPIWTQDVDFGGVTKSHLLYGPLPVFRIGINGYNSLMLRYNLNHSLRVTVDLPVYDISIIWVVKHPHVVWDILFVSIVLAS